MGISFDQSRFNVIPIHRAPELMRETIDLINQEWPRSIGARLWSLESSKDELPTCLVLKQTKSTCDKDKNSPNVLAHLKLTPIPSLPFACFIETVVVWKQLRGLGLGKYFMNEAEKYCKYTLKLHEVYLSTTDKEEFYLKLGYEFCEPVSIYGGPVGIGGFKNVTKKKYMKKVLVEPSSDEDQSSCVSLCSVQSCDVIPKNIEINTEKNYIFSSRRQCFLTYWTGSSVKCLKKSKSKPVANNSENESLIEKHFKVVAIHKRRDLVDETIKLINSHWPKSRSERLSILGTSNDDLPMSLIVILKRRGSEDEVMRELFGEYQMKGKNSKVFGHLHLVPVPSDDKACFIESMVVHHDFRGKGIGSFFITNTEKFCENVLHLKSIFLSTYDSGEFYMKIGFQLTSAICVYGNGEVNTVTKKIFLKKNLNYVEPEVEEEPEDVYDPTKDYNYQQQSKIECDVILSGFPFKLEQPRSVITKLCQILNYPSDIIRYYYSFEFFNRKTSLRSFHMIISTNSVEAKDLLMEKLDNFGVLCFQNFFDNPVNDFDNTLISHQIRLTNLNYVIRKELEKLLEHKWISEFKYENFQFQAKQDEKWIIVKDLEVVDFLKTPELPDVPDEEIEDWDVPEDESLEDKLIKMRQEFKIKLSNDDWIESFRRPSQITLEPLDSNYSLKEKVFTFKTKDREIEATWVESLSSNNSDHDALTMGLAMNEIF